MRKYLAAAAVVAVSTGIAMSAPTAARASGAPPYEPDPHSVGGITFYGSDGNVITSGSTTDKPMAAYVAGSATIRNGDTSAVLIGAQPNPDAATATTTWNKDFMSAFTSYPISSGAPASIQTLSQSVPVVTGAATDLSLGDFIAEFPNTSGTDSHADWQNLYQLRLKTANGSDQTTSYDVADVLVNGTTWTEVYPNAGTPTTTTLDVSPSGSSKQGASVTLTAQVSLSTDSSTHPAGHVQFKDGSKSIGSPATVNTTTGAATLTTTALPPSGPNGALITANFSPSGSGIAPSSSAATHYTVNPVASKPSISGKAAVGSTVNCAEASTSGETVKYAWRAGSASVGSGKSLTIPASAYKKTLTCTATVSAGGGPKSSATSAGKKVALGKALKAKKSPKLSGPGKVGKKESVSAGSWKPKATSFSYQWFDRKMKISGATKSKLKLTKSEKGHKVSCVVTARAKGHAPGSARSNAVKVA